MSQKSTRRGRRQTNDEDNTALSKLSLKKSLNGGAEETAKPSSVVQIPQIVIEEASKPETNGNSSNEKLEIKDSDSEILTRSRSQTPQNKKNEEKSLNGNDLEVAANEEIASASVLAEQENEMKPPEEGIVLNSKDLDSEMMDPLILSDEPDPELLFEENSDLESGKGSPILYRSKTRRSLNRNIPTPKTPKSAVDDAETPPPEAEQDINHSLEEDSENMSTRVEVGSDATRLDYNDDDSTTENHFLNSSKNKSFGETLRHLSTRRTIRPISDDYRKRALQYNFDKNDFSASSYPTRNSVDRISITGGLKRKQSSDNSSDEDDSGKRFKVDGGANTGFFARFTSPLKSIRNSFRSEVPPASSTPKLTGYKDQNCSIEDEEKVCELNDEKRWCSIM